AGCPGALRRPEILTGVLTATMQDPSVRPRRQAKGRASSPSEHRRQRATLQPIFRACKAGRQSHVELRGFEPLPFLMSTCRHIEPTFENSCSNTCSPSIEVHRSLLISIPVAVLLCCTAASRLQRRLKRHPSALCPLGPGRRLSPRWVAELSRSFGSR